MKAMASMFSPSWYYLEQEGCLAHACLCNGLTALRQANLGDKKGHFYPAFFELSIGLERMLKLIVILDHMAENELVPPSENEVRDFGHELTTLFVRAKEVSVRRCPSILTKLRDDELGIVLLNFLHRFAQSSGRYSNLNKLTGGKQQDIQDPLAQWGAVASEIIRTRASKRDRARIQATGAFAHQKLGSVSSSLMGDLNQRMLGVGDLFVKASELDIASKYAAFAFVSLIESLREPLGLATMAAQQLNLSADSSSAAIPHMAGFFEFAWADKTHTLNKRRWP